MSKLSYKPLMEYFEALVTQHHALETFVGFSKQDLTNSLNKLKGKKYPLLALTDYQGKLKGNIQRTFAVRTIFFGIGFGGIDLTDYQKQYTAIANAESYGLELLARINYDSKYVEKEHWLYNNFEKESVEFTEMRHDGPAGMYGMYFSFDIKVPEPFAVNPAHWADIDTTC